jgi:nucleoside-diphosphate-sugar epimerase
VRALVTGGAGFIGSTLVRALLARGDEVRVLDDLSSGRAANLEGLAIDFRGGDVRDRAAVADAVDGVDVVFHEAAQVSVPRSVLDPEETRAINVDGTACVLAACEAARVRA